MIAPLMDNIWRVKIMITEEKQISIAIVEDFKLTRVGLRCALNSNPDLEVVAECEDAIDGIEQIKKLSPDVVLMDLGLPTMNGIEAMVKIREFSNSVKIIALTSHDREEEVLALRFGLYDGTCHTLEEVGKKFNVTRERIRQIEAKALRKLRHPSRAKKLKDFLSD